MTLSLALPAPRSDSITELRRIFRNSLASAHTKRAYIAAFNQFFALAAETGRPVCHARERKPCLSGSMFTSLEMNRRPSFSIADLFCGSSPASDRSWRNSWRPAQM